MAEGWVQDPRTPSGWRWIDATDTGAAVPAHELGVTRQEPAMTDVDAVPSSPHVLDPTIGSDGGGHTAHDGMPGNEDTQSVALPTHGLVACPTCGTGVAPDRLRA